MGPILVATDLGARSDRAVARAAMLATATGASLHVVAVVDDDLPAEVVLAREAEAGALLAKRFAGAARPPTIHVETGHPARMVPRVAVEVGASLLVLGGHRGRGWTDWVSEPTLGRILRAAPCDALVALSPPEAGWDRVVVGWDGSPAGRAAARLARRLAPAAELIPAHAVAPPSGPAVGEVLVAMEVAQAGEAEARAMLERLSRDVEGPVGTPELRVGGVPWVLDRVAADRTAQAIAVGRHTRTGLARLLIGQAALALALSTERDVMVAAPPEG